MQCIISHTGIKGMHWGIRRYQNEDGSLTPAGKARYAKTGEYGYQYKSRFTKRAEKRTAKYGQKAKEAMAKGDTKKAEKFKEKEKYNRAFAKYNAKIDKRMQEYASKATLGQRLLTGKRRLTAYAISDIKPTDPMFRKGMAVANASLTSYGTVSVYGSTVPVAYRILGSTARTRYSGFERERERH